MFVRTASGWTQQAKLTASDGAAGHVFGSAAAIDGGTAVVGAPSGFFGAGAAYVFVRTAGVWTEQAVLVSSNPSALATFGSSVAVDGDTVVVGAPHPVGLSPTLGEACVFTRTGTTWTEQDSLQALDAEVGEWFGTSVSIAGDLALIGSSKDDDLGPDSGSAYVFLRSGSSWNQQAELLSGDGAAFDRFGSAVTIDATTAVVGAWGEDEVASGAGAAYVFTQLGTSWIQQAKLTASDGDTGDIFGGSLSLDGDTLLVGANIDEGGGSAYVFRGAGAAWSEVKKLQASNGADGESYGYSVGVDGDIAVVGANLHAGVGTDSGAAYVYENVTAVVSYGAGCAGTGGRTPFLAVTGDLSPGATFSIEVGDGLASSQALVFIGTGQAAFPIGSAGCTLNVFPLLPTTVGPFALSASGSGSVAIPTPAVTALVTFTLQAFVLDSGVSGGFSNSNGVSVELAP